MRLSSYLPTLSQGTAESLFTGAIANPAVKELLSELRTYHYNTYAHSMDVGRLFAAFCESNLFAQYFGNEFASDTITKQQLVIAATLHDIGKLCVDQDVLEYPGKYNSERQWSQIRQHPIDTFKILLERLPDTIPMALAMALLHHLFQVNPYPIQETVDDLLHSADIKMTQAYMVAAFALSVCDKLDAMTPMQYKGHNGHSYADRAYDITDVPARVKATFIGVPMPAEICPSLQDRVVNYLGNIIVAAGNQHV